VREGHVVASRIVTLTGSIDHRWIDGLTLANTLIGIKKNLEGLSTESVSASAA
jgi:pyruvate/2-oxoglutarate dehydrogenase complex dihydrolipoamide acyltransferase (E2) component